MKRFKPIVSDGGAPIFLTDLIKSDVDIFTALNSIVSSMDDTIVLTGCEITNLNTVGGTLDISSGVVWLDGEIREVGAYSGSYPVYIESSADVNDDRDFEDGSPETLYITKSAEFTTSVPSGNSISFNPYTSKRLVDVIKRGTTKTGEIIIRATNTDNFDPTGLGIFEYEGFALCNGSNGTVDLREKFIVGQNPADAQYNPIGQTGGLENVTLDISQIPSHSHNISNVQNFLYFTGSGSGWGPAGAGSGATPSIDNTGGGGSHENRPPYFVVAYIQRI